MKRLRVTGKRSLVRPLLVASVGDVHGAVPEFDGKPVPVLQGNVALQTVAFPAGSHTVVFSFVPRSPLLGVGVAVAGLGVLVAHLIYAARSRRRRAAGDSPNASVERAQET